jgi:hypothetical protein
MITCKLQGGLGNQLFQIFTTIAYALRYNNSFFFLNNHQLGNGENGVIIRYTYWDSFFKELTPFLKNINQIPQLMFIREEGFNYIELPENLDKNYGTMLVGYFQSPLYFEKYKEGICKLIKINLKKFIVRNKVKDEIDFDNDNIISMHFRLGDYKKYPDIHPILSNEYYVNALTSILIKQQTNTLEYNTIQYNQKVLYFCENEDLSEVESTITHLKTKFPFLKFQRANPLLSDWEQMLLMSLCEDNIIANSSFSWWGAYLNSNIGKTVCYPETWFGTKAGHDTSDLFPEDWTPISLS